jgi:hypothetical protein
MFQLLGHASSRLTYNAPVMARTIGDVITEVTGSAADQALAEWISEWPPDVFAMTSTILAESGAYRCVVSPPSNSGWPPQDRPNEWEDTVQRTTELWIAWCERKADEQEPGTNLIVPTVEGVLALRHIPIHDLGQETHWPALCRLLTLNATADEACAGLGLGRSIDEDSALYTFEANKILTATGSLSRFPVSRIRVLPKMRTPQTGISIRSLSMHATNVRCEVGVKWLRRDYPRDDIRKERLKLLIFPWPFEVTHEAFVPVRGPLKNLATDKFGFFEFRPQYSPADLKQTFEHALNRAQAESGPIDAVVLPECAVTDEEFESLWACSHAAGVHVLLAGVRGPNTNEARLKAGIDDPKPIVQHKHHRWCLDGGQIGTYNIGAALNPAVRWWESMDLRQRELTFVTFNDWLTLCHLVCEDLARFDPVAQVVRAVGPTLLIALLLDGPQLGHRWSARYASVLSEDPGTSVLTVTALGMALRSTPLGTTPKRTVAFWRDTRFGDRPIDLEVGAIGVVLTLWAEYIEEFTADGRRDGGCAGRVIFGGISQVAP